LIGEYGVRTGCRCILQHAEISTDYQHTIMNKYRGAYFEVDQCPEITEPRPRNLKKECDDTLSTKEEASELEAGGNCNIVTHRVGVKAVMMVKAPEDNPKLKNQGLGTGCRSKTEKIPAAAAHFAA